MRVALRCAVLAAGLAGATAAQTDNYPSGETRRWTKVMRDAGIKPQ